MLEKVRFRDADLEDLSVIVDIYNSTIPSRMVTADTEPITVNDRLQWFEEHSPTKRPLWVVEYEMRLWWSAYNLSTEDRHMMQPLKLVFIFIRIIEEKDLGKWL
ncbi:putative phosphinothricin N-acetyltransferase [Halalkalibacter wakoensis JCM 9140]|uniref:Putative phosphinothricin N-acetyltransferase n=1 Tax=Halalkalibacter wakoensis JCM 9140 TaxID=1236970 RepID=W4QA27_9BACI|nr:putative phosphinothricin N-acetyltransferase [Halalkalibacter wakoensis JCM 9140]